MNAVKPSIFQAEIMMLLHDIGKLHWRFVGNATKQCEGKWALSALHTVAFLADVTDEETQKKFKDATSSALQERLENEPLPDLQRVLWQRIPWYTDQNGSVSTLGSLLALHHLKGIDKALYTFLCKHCIDNEKEHPLLCCAMYADTADSQFTKGNETTEDSKQGETLFLARPLGGIDTLISSESIAQDAEDLANELLVWAENAASWDTETLVTKRRELIKILKHYGKRHLAETRLPNNDVSLWQHSYATASICKALVASYLLAGSWDSVLENDHLTHAKQRLALLAVRFDDATYLSRNVRSFDIVGKRAVLHQLCCELKTLVEESLAIGNEIYRDNQGICFLVPDLQSIASDKAQQVFTSLCQSIDNLCNGGHFQGELPWKLQITPSGLRLTDMLKSWKEPFADIISSMPSNDTHVWQKAWQTTRPQQICPRCGLRPIPLTPSRTGGEETSSCCPACQEIRDIGGNVIRSLRMGDATDFSNFGKEAFGLSRIPDIPDFWNMLDADEQGTATADEEGKDSRLALVQGVIPLDPLYDNSLFSSLLSPLPKDWDSLEKEVIAAWKRVREGDVHDEKGKGTGTVLDTLFKKSKEDVFGTKYYGGEADGWCCDAKEGHYQRRWIENMVFEGTLHDPTNAQEERMQAQAIIRWGLRQHPAPSRMARIWEETRAFMRSAFALANEQKIPFVPLTCDAGTFQLLVPSQRALAFLQSVAQHYEQIFNQVRHILPLHLSASVFYHKAPLYIAMDAARRFREYATSCPREWWKLTSKKNDPQGTTSLTWNKADGRTVTWTLSTTLPNGRKDPYHTWFVDEQGRSVPLAEAQEGTLYGIRPSTFDFEVLDASTRRYDIRYENGRRPHFMMPKKAGPRPYPLEELNQWQHFAPLFAAKAQSQRKNMLELLARLHGDWGGEDKSPIFTKMLHDIVYNALDEIALSEPLLHRIEQAALDGTLFDLFEWFDFLESPVTGENP